MPLDTYANVKVSQTWNSSHYIYEIIVNGRLSTRVVNYSPQIFRNVVLYASDPWRHPPEADIKNLVFENIPNGNDKFQLLVAVFDLD